jgi:drug/metabolite transporter (DMT)-like permease
MGGLNLTQTSSTSLLLNLEVVFTALLAWVFFREGFERRVALGMALVVLGCAALSLPEDLAPGSIAGPLMVAGACLFWAVDNNVTRTVSERDPVQVAMLKGLAGGGATALAAALLGKPWPEPRAAAGLLAVGALAYGLSLVLFIRSLRQAGTARTGLGFAVAPFVGAALSFLILGDRLSLGFAAGLLLVGLGLYLTLSASHRHGHSHEAVSHDHAHAHDDHHRHEHSGEGAPREPHAHPHEHEVLKHAHPHLPDTHHRHSH